MVADDISHIMNHMAFYSLNVIRQVVQNTLKCMKAYADGEDLPNRLV